VRFALLGHPVHHSISPQIHGAAFAALGLPHTYERIDVPSEADLARAAEAIRRGDLAGANVTVPHKRAVLALVDAIDESASSVGAANVLCRRGASELVAHNTDEAALAADLAQLLGARPRDTAAILGAGGAGLAAASAAKKLGFCDVFVTTRSWSSPAAAASSPYAPRILALGARAVPFPSADSSADPEERAWIERADLIVQATSAGMTGAGSGDAIASIIPWERLSRAPLVYDVVYTPPVTPFLRAASQAGLDAIGGLGMLVRQAALSFTLWTGAPAPLDEMRAAAERALRRPSP
jgi:shikimate dehydrogenase